MTYGYAPFWSKVGLDLAMRPSSKLGQKVAFWVAHAQDTLLDVTILDSAGSRSRGKVPIDDTDLASLADALCETMSRWRSLKIAVLHEHVNFLLQRFIGLVPSLSTFDLHVLYDGFRTGNFDCPSFSVHFTPHPDIEARAPLAVSAINSIVTFPLFGAAITKVSASMPSAVTHVDDILRMLESCPNLEDFYLDINVARLTGEPSLGHSVVLPHLTSLRLPGLQYISGLLNFLEPPSLQTFEISRIMWGIESVWGSHIVDALRRIFRLCTSLSTVRMTSYRIDEAVDDPYTPFGGRQLILPCVTHFEVIGSPIAYPLLQQLSLPQVDTLNIRAVPYDILYRLASSSTQLRTLTTRDITEAPQNTPLLLLPVLTTLDAVDCPTLLRNLHTPQLMSLDAGLRLLKSPNILEESSFFLRLIERSVPPLVDLILIGLDIPDTDLISCLRALPTLKNLQLSMCKTSDAVLRALARPSSSDNGSSWILPQLTTFTFSFNFGTTPSGIIELIASRNAVSDEANASGLAVAGVRPPRINGEVDFDFGISEGEYSKLTSLIGIGNFTYGWVTSDKSA
ncbi:hypothetical protein BOTBODRAFT_284388 [Botryobasidium botryosum FD-172 SS1]|uniref:F-box domain-containing protein n=1 Tax=Botryobasidium botryosum (strain FD-172 SS1) TaxID=930990 RepID=A0A067MLQ8_BOTB1|nr:hypothetical protein BOTBODRAFT_284388 [Botryobasidium botryosum FD-172 SS1]